MTTRLSMTLAAALGLTLLGGCAGRTVGRLPSDPLPRMTFAEAPRAGVSSDEDVARAILLAHHARLAMAERRCDDAVSLMEQARALSPSFPDTSDAHTLAERCGVEGAKVSFASRR